MSNGTMPQTIVVLVQGLPIGWYNNSVDGKMPVEVVIIRDLEPHIDATYRIIKKAWSQSFRRHVYGRLWLVAPGFQIS